MVTTMRRFPPFLLATFLFAVACDRAPMDLQPDELAEPRDLVEAHQFMLNQGYSAADIATLGFEHVVGVDLETYLGWIEEEQARLGVTFNFAPPPPDLTGALILAQCEEWETSVGISGQEGITLHDGFPGCYGSGGAPCVGEAVVATGASLAAVTAGGAALADPTNVLVIGAIAAGIGAHGTYIIFHNCLRDAGFYAWANQQFNTFKDVTTSTFSSIKQAAFLVSPDTGGCSLPEDVGDWTVEAIEAYEDCVDDNME